MKILRIVIPLLAASLSGCVPAYSLVRPGVQTAGSMQVTVSGNWNEAPGSVTPSSRKDSRTWTQDGLLLDRMLIIPGVPDGEPLFVSRDKSAALPPFRADMLPNEIEELVESSIVKLYGEGNAAVNTANLRPQKFAERTGFMFDIEAAVSGSPDYRGMIGAFVAEERLYLLVFLAAEPHYYDKHRDRAAAIIKSAGVL